MFLSKSLSTRKYFYMQQLGAFIIIGCVFATTTGLFAMNTKPQCNLAPVQRSQEMIRAILDDLTTYYTQVGGGGITEIRQSATDTFVVLIAQEERYDEITYAMRITPDCKAQIVKRSESAINPQ